MAHMMMCGAGGREVCGAIRSSAGKAANQVSSSTLYESGAVRRARFLRKKPGRTYLSSEMRLSRTGDCRLTRKAYTVVMMRSSMTARRQV